MRVLIVDDEPNMRRLLQLNLEHAGHEVVQAADGQEGLRRFLEHRPDLVLMDVHIPYMDGVEVTRAILEAQPSAKVVAYCGSADETLQQKALAAGAKEFQSPLFSGPEGLLQLVANYA